MIIGFLPRPSGRPVLFIGLSDENLRRLCLGQPIHKDREALNLSDSTGASNLDGLVILHGVDEANILDQLKPLMNANTEVRKEGAGS